MNRLGVDGVESLPANIVFDIETASPEVFEALTKASPDIVAHLTRLRSGIPRMSSAASGIQGAFYRLRKHNRSICLALSADKAHSDVIVLKGTEPVLADFDEYLSWMSKQTFGDVRPTTEHFPLMEGKAPGCVYLSEAKREAEMALALQQEHLAHYRELGHFPAPLLVYEVPQPSTTRIVAQLKGKISHAAFDRVEPYLKTGLGVYAYYYPAPPVRVHAVGSLECFLPGQEALAERSQVTTVAVPGWTTLFARLLWLGYFPVTALAWNLGAIFDPNNACLDGGGCDIGTIFAMRDVSDDGFFGQSFFFSFGCLRQTIALALGLPMGEIPRDYTEAMVATSLEDFLRGSLDKAIETESRASLSLDPRIAKFTGRKSLPELLAMFGSLPSGVGHSDYRDYRSRPTGRGE